MRPTKRNRFQNAYRRQQNTLAQANEIPQRFRDETEKENGECQLMDGVRI